MNDTTRTEAQRSTAPASFYQGTADSNGQPFCSNCGQILAAHRRGDHCPPYFVDVEAAFEAHADRLVADWVARTTRP